MTHFQSSWWVRIAVGLALAVCTLPARGADKNADASRSRGAEGIVMDIRMDAHELMIQRSDGKALTVEVPDKAWIQRDNNSFGKLSDLKKGETVSVIYYLKNGKNEAALVTEGAGGAGRNPR